MPAAYLIRPDGPMRYGGAAGGGKSHFLRALDEDHIGGWGFWCRCGSSRLGGPSEAWARDALADHRRDVHGEGGTA